MFIVWDDTGFGALSPFGGPIETPTMERLSAGGLRYTQFHTTALCSPTRSSMLTGRNHTTVGMACICEATTGFPGSNGHIPFETATIAEVLGERGYNTYMLGKWHCCPEDETNMASTKRNWPTGRGFERYYGFLGGETNQWYPDLVQDQQFVDQPYGPPKDWSAGLGDDYHLSKDLVDRAIGMIADAKQVAPEKPFFMYFCPGANHAPHHAPKEWADKLQGQVRHGLREDPGDDPRAAEEAGIVPGEHRTVTHELLRGRGERRRKAVEPGRDRARMGCARRPTSKALFVRMAEVYAGFCSYTDYEIGRLIDYLEATGELDNTMIVVISDNGASGEGGPNGSVNENNFFNSVVDDIDENMKYLDRLGSADTYNHYPIGWAMAFNTPFKLWKRHSWNGGICDPMVVHWPAGIKAKGEIRDQYTHCSDIVPTVYECLGLEPPPVVKGYTQWDLEGTSFKYSFDAADVPCAEGESVLRHARDPCASGTRAGKRKRCTPAPGNWSHFTEDRWELYNTRGGPLGVPRPGRPAPEQLEELKSLWFHEAGKFFGLPLEDRSAVEVLTTPRPQMSRPATATSTTRTRWKCPRPSPSTSAAGRTGSPPRSTSR